MALLGWDDLFFNPEALTRPTAAPNPWAPVLEPVAAPQAQSVHFKTPTAPVTPIGAPMAPPVSPKAQPASWAALDSEPVLSPRVPLSPSPQANYDPFAAFGRSPSRPPAQSKPGLLGQSFGIMTPDEQQQWLADQFKARETGLARIDNLKKMIAASPSPVARRALEAQLRAEEGGLPNLEQLNAMQEGRAPLPIKTGLRAATENVPRGFAEAVLGIPEFIGIVKGYLSDHDVDDDNLVKWSLGAKDYVKGLFPGDVARQNEFSQQLASGLGQIAAFYGGGAVTALMKAGPKAVAAVTSLMGASATGSAGFEEATKELAAAQERAKMTGDVTTATELDRILKTFGYATVGLTEAIPIAKTFSRAIPENIPARIAQGVEGAAEEALQEGGSQLAQNLITQQTTDPNRATMEGVAEGAAVGAVLGGGMGAAFPGRAGRAAEPRIEEVDPFIEEPEIRPGEPLSFIDLMPGEGYTEVNVPSLAAPARALPAPEAGMPMGVPPAPTPQPSTGLDASVRGPNMTRRSFLQGLAAAMGTAMAPPSVMQAATAVAPTAKPEPLTLEEIIEQKVASLPDGVMREVFGNMNVQILEDPDDDSGVDYDDVDDEPFIRNPRGYLKSLKRFLDIIQEEGGAFDYGYSVGAGENLAPEQMTELKNIIADVEKTYKERGTNKRKRKAREDVAAPKLSTPEELGKRIGELNKHVVQIRIDTPNEVVLDYDNKGLGDRVRIEGPGPVSSTDPALNGQRPEDIFGPDLLAQIRASRPGTKLENYPFAASRPTTPPPTSNILQEQLTQILSDVAAKRNWPEAFSAGLREQVLSRPEEVEKFLRDLGVMPMRPPLSLQSPSEAPVDFAKTETQEPDPVPLPQPSTGLDASTRPVGGFYSTAMRAAEALPEKGSPEQLLGILRNTPGVKPGELEWMGLEDFVRDQKPKTRQEVVDYIAANQVELVDDERAFSPEYLALATRKDELERELIGSRGRDLSAKEIGAIAKELHETFLKLAQHPEHTTTEGKPKYLGRGQPAGGTNYRELLLKSPSVSDTNYRSAHFNTNELLHLRLDDRVGPAGEKVLNIVELQSDLHQKGRRFGYRGTKEQLAKMQQEFDAGMEQLKNARANNLPADQVSALIKRVGTLQDEMYRMEGPSSVPNAPFKGGSWEELGVKRVLQMAAEQGYDAVSWVRGEQTTGSMRGKVRTLYDVKIPGFLNRYTKKWGGKVETATLHNSEGENNILRITPEMRTAILGGGQPLWSARPEPAEKPAQKAEQPLPEQPFKAVGEPAEGTARPVEISPKLTLKQVAVQGKILLDAGRTVQIPQELTESVTRVFEELAQEIPANIGAGTMTRVEPAGFDDAGKPYVNAVFTMRDGTEKSWLFEWKNLVNYRAFSLGGDIFFPCLNPADSGRERIRGILRHELVHGVRRKGNIPANDFNRLFGHAIDLRILDMDYAAFARATQDPGAPDYDDGATIRDVYGDLYRTRPDIEERLAQEAVAHMVELASHGALSAEQLAPIQDLMDKLRSGAYSTPVTAPVRAQVAQPDAALGGPPGATLIHNKIGALATKVYDLGLDSLWDEATQTVPWHGDAIEYAKGIIQGLNKVKNKPLISSANSGKLNQIKQELEDALISVGVTRSEIYAYEPVSEPGEPQPEPEVVKATSSSDASPVLANAVIKASNLAHEAGGKVSELFKFAVLQANSKVDSTQDFVGWVKALQSNVMLVQGEVQLAKQSEQLGAISVELLNGLATAPVPEKPAGPKPALEWTDAEIDALMDEDFAGAKYLSPIAAIGIYPGSQNDLDFLYWAIDEAKKMAKAAGQSTLKPAFIKIIIDQAKALGKLKGEESKQAAFYLAKLAQDLLPGSAVKSTPSPQPLSLSAAKLLAKNMGDDVAFALDEAIAANPTPNAVEHIKLEGVATLLGAKAISGNISPEMATSLKKLVRGLFAGADNLKKAQSATPTPTKPAPTKAPPYSIEDALIEAAANQEAYGNLAQIYDLLKEDAEGGVVLPEELASAVEGKLEFDDYVEDPEAIALLKNIVAKLEGKETDPHAVEKASIAKILNTQLDKQYPTIKATVDKLHTNGTAKHIINETAKNLYENVPAFKSAGPFPAASTTAEFKKALKDQLVKTIYDNIAQGTNSYVVEDLAQFVAALDPATYTISQPKPPTPAPAGLTFDDLIPAPKQLNLTFFQNAGGGTKPKEIWRDDDGNEYLFKPVPNSARFLAYGEAAGGHISRLINPKAPRIWVQELSGRLGSIQEMLPNSGTLKGVAMEDLTLEEAQALQREHVVDWLISNHDGHANQFLVLGDGEIVGIDKGQAFKYFGKDKLDINYHPNQVYGEKEPIYNTFWRAYSKKQLPKVQKRLEEDYVDDLKKLDDEIKSLEKDVGELRDQANAAKQEVNEFAEKLNHKISQLTAARNVPADMEASVAALEKAYLERVGAAMQLKEDEFWTESAAPGHVVVPISKDPDYATGGTYGPALQKITIPQLKNGISLADAEKYLGVPDLDNGQKLLSQVWGSTARQLVAALVKAGYDHVMISPGDWVGKGGGAIVLKTIQEGELRPWVKELAPLARQHTRDVVHAALRYLSESMRLLANDLLGSDQHEQARAAILETAEDLLKLDPSFAVGSMDAFEYTNEANQTRNPIQSLVARWLANTGEVLGKRYRQLEYGRVRLAPGSEESPWVDLINNNGYHLINHLSDYFQDIRELYADEGTVKRADVHKLNTLANQKQFELENLTRERETLKERGNAIMFRAANEAIDALQQKLSTDDFLAILRPYAEGRWPNRPASVDAFLDYARQRKENLAAKFHRFFVGLDDVRKRGGRALREAHGYDGGYKNHAQSFNKRHGTDLTGDEYAAIHYYTNSSFRVLNEHLRADKPIKTHTTPNGNIGHFTPSKEWLQSMEYAAILEAALEKLPPYKGQAFRGQKMSDAELAEMIPGRILHNKTFFSTSRTGGFGGRVRFIVDSLTGRDIQNLSGHPSENEVLFAPNRNFYITFINPDGIHKHDNVIEIYLEELPQGIDFNDLS